MPNLLFCMTPGMGLHTWEKIGTLQRELKPYTEYVKRGWNVKVLTFDKGSIPELPEGIEAVRFPDRKLLWLLPWLHKRTGQWADLIKTNQSVHAYFYTHAARQWGKPILLRCGYVHGEYLETTMCSGLRKDIYQFMEKKAFGSASHCEVPTEDLSRWVTKRYAINSEKISVVPNFVDTETFRPHPEITKIKLSVIAVGRLTSVKNYDLLIKACSEIPQCHLTIVGKGPEHDNLQALANDLNVSLDLAGNIPNNELPRLIQRHEIFVIFSSWEGHPKALIEAMACGMPCVGAEAPGIEAVITHRQNGLLIKPLVEDLVSSFKELFQDPALCSRLSREARETINKRFSFSHCFSREYKIALQLLS